jgi:hypothetical protein
MPADSSPPDQPHLHHHHHRAADDKRQPDEFYESMVRLAAGPGLYFGSPSSYLQALQHYLQGYENAVGLYGGPSLELGPAFSRWLTTAKHLEGGPALSWTEILRRNFPVDTEAYSAFFDLFDEYHITVTTAPERNW